MTEKERIKLHDRIRKSVGRFYENEIVKKCVELIETEGYVVLDDQFPDADIKEKQGASSILSNTGQYMLDKQPYDEKWVVRKNPSYSLSRSVKLTNKIQRVVLVLTLSTAVGAATISYLNYKKINDTKVYLIPRVEEKDTVELQKLKPKETPIPIDTAIH
jgi:hypothetical protein